MSKHLNITLNSVDWRIVGETIESWILRQICPWKGFKIKRTDAENYLKRISDENPEFFVFEIKNNSVSIIEKQNHLNQWEGLQIRSEQYRSFFSEIAKEMPTDFETIFGICVSDSSIDSDKIPTFSFQKNVTGKSILIPDVDIISKNFSPFEDKVDYENKKHHAFFVGATTGGIIKEEDLISGNSIDRIKAAEFFNESEHTTFELPIICGCATSEAEEFLISKGYGNRNIRTNDDIYSNRFVLSLDGNGATCSRVMNTLSSNSILLKHKSESILYYFYGLREWEHYIPINNFSEVNDIVRNFKDNPESLRRITYAANRFNELFLTKIPVYFYVKQALENYNSIFY